MKITIFGATGVIGTGLCQEVSSLHPEWDVQAVTRNADAPSRLKAHELANVRLVSGDPLNVDSVLSLSKDSDVIVSCIGFQQYQAKYWATHWPIVVENLLKATTHGDKKRRLIFCDNLYAYGAGHDDPISPLTKTVPAKLDGGKPGIRSWMRETFERHMQENPGTISVVGGADFFGPYVTDKTFLGDTLTGKIVHNGGSALCIASPNQIHDFCYTKDFSKALLTAVTSDKALDRFWVCPHAIHGKTFQEIANDIATKADKPTPVKFSSLNKFLIYLMSPFMGFMYEMIEMYPFFAEKYEVDDSDFCSTFGATATPYDVALQEYVDFYKSLKQ